METRNGSLQSQTQIHVKAGAEAYYLRWRNHWQDTLNSRLTELLDLSIITRGKYYVTDTVDRRKSKRRSVY